MTSHVLCTKNEVFDAITLLTELYAHIERDVSRATIRCDFNDLLAGFEPILQVLLEVKYTINIIPCLVSKKKARVLCSSLPHRHLSPDSGFRMRVSS